MSRIGNSRQRFYAFVGNRTPRPLIHDSRPIVRSGPLYCDAVYLSRDLGSLHDTHSSDFLRILSPFQYFKRCSAFWPLLLSVDTGMYTLELGSLLK